MTQVGKAFIFSNNSKSRGKAANEYIQTSFLPSFHPSSSLWLVFSARCSLWSPDGSHSSGYLLVMPISRGRKGMSPTCVALTREVILPRSIPIGLPFNEDSASKSGKGLTFPKVVAACKSQQHWDPVGKRSGYKKANNNVCHGPKYV